MIHIEDDSDLKCDERLDDDLIIFTDGSVDQLFGGFGAFITSWKFYKHQRLFFTPQDFVDCIEKHVMNKDIVAYDDFALSPRCSIDYCEATAIYENLCWLAREYTVYYNNYGVAPDYLFHAENIRIFSDSQTVLYWIKGQYKIKSNFMKHIIDNILWYTSFFEECGYNVIYQYTPGHSGVFGNEIADILAKRGMRKCRNRFYNNTDSENFAEEDNWRYISSKYINTTIKLLFYKHQHNAFHRHLKNTQFGTINQRLKWKSREVRQDEMRIFNRIELRWVLAIRSGHNYFRYFQYHRYNKGSSGACNLCGYIKQDVTHMILECTHELVIFMRKYLKEDIWTYYHEMYENRDMFQYQIDEIYRKINWNDIMTYIDSWEDFTIVKARVLQITIKYLDRLLKFVK